MQGLTNVPVFEIIQLYIAGIFLSGDPVAPSIRRKRGAKASTRERTRRIGYGGGSAAVEKSDEDGEEKERQ